MPEPIDAPQLPPDLQNGFPPLKSVQSVSPESIPSSDQLTRVSGSFVEYVAEDDQAYQVRTRSRRLFEVAKRRPTRTPYPPPQPSPLRPAYRWLAIAALGLMLSGLGALLLAPIAGLAALRAQRGKLSPADYSRARLVVLLAGLLIALGAGLAFLFWLHVRG